jgi:Uma2 family endonuclease
MKLSSEEYGMAVQDRLYTAQDLATMPDDGKVYELHNGVLIEVARSKYGQSQLAAWLIHLILSFVEQQGLGGETTGADGAAVLNEFNTRIPDVSYISAERVRIQDRDSYIQGAPDLAIEVVSPSNSDLEMQPRAAEYLLAGARLVWIVNPSRKTVDVYLPHGTRTVFSADDVLDGGDVLPGLALSLRKVFKTGA